jgi:hypothetical protein
MLVEGTLHEKIVARDPDAAWRTMDEETIVITPTDSVMHSLNEVGAYIWYLADGNCTVRDIIEGVCEEFDVDPDTAEADTLEFIRALADKGMLRILE